MDNIISIGDIMKRVLVVFSVLVVIFAATSCSSSSSFEEEYTIKFENFGTPVTGWSFTNNMKDMRVKVGDIVVFANPSAEPTLYMYEIGTTNKQLMDTLYALPDNSTTGIPMNEQFVISESFVKNADSNNVITLYAYTGNCFVEGSKVTMANGSKQNIEDVKIGDSVLSYNFYTGKFEPKKVLLIEKGKSVSKIILTVKTYSGKEIEIAGYHSFFDAEAKKDLDIGFYNYKEMTGKKILSVSNGKLVTEEIISIEAEYREAEYYTIVTEDNLNCIVEDCITNIPIYASYMPFEVNDQFIVDADKMAEDIATYGLYTYEDYPFDVPENIFNKMNFKYHKILVGKGMTDYSSLEAEIYGAQYMLENWIVQ